MIAVPDALYSAILALCVALILIGTTIATRIEEGLRWIRAAVPATLAIAAVGMIMYTFIRSQATAATRRHDRAVPARRYPWCGRPTRSRQELI